MDNFINSIQNEKDLIEKYNALSKHHSEKGSLLAELTDIEFFIWIVGKTYKYGRSFRDSVSNAACHMKNRTKAEKLFSVQENDLLGFE